MRCSDACPEHTLVRLRCRQRAHKRFRAHFSSFLGTRGTILAVGKAPNEAISPSEFSPIPYGTHFRPHVAQLWYG